MSKSELIEYADGTKRWYLNGKLHREDGPAFECANGSKGWYLNGKRVTGEDVLRYAVERGNTNAVESILWKKYICLTDGV